MPGSYAAEVGRPFKVKFILGIRVSEEPKAGARQSSTPPSTLHNSVWYLIHQMHAMKLRLTEATAS